MPPPEDAHPIDPLIRTHIMAKLAAVEAEHGVRVLYACESGSRGWGFASPDSDYDVRFVYVRPLRDYLRLSAPRDVIEEAPGPVFDVNGWDLRKALQLLAKGNATLVEWMNSPVVYRKDETFVRRLQEAAAAVYQPARSFHHYHAMARGNYREYLQGPQVRAKKYLYVLRPLLAAQWVLTHDDAPPMAFESLVAAMVDDAAVKADIAELLVLKRQAGEQDWLPARPTLNKFMDGLLAGMADRQPDLAHRPLAPLDALFADTLLSA